MADSTSAITAIRNAKEESFVAATLVRMEWTICHRATSSDGLIIAAQSNPGAFIIADLDFGVEQYHLPNPLILLNPREEVTSEYLQDLLRRSSKADSPQLPSIPLCTSTTTVIATVDSGVGGTTCAINVAFEKSQLGNETLLLDFNQDNPYLAQYFDLQRINRSIVPTPFGFALSEVSDPSYFSNLALAANNFGDVVIDLGRVPVGDQLYSGNRIHEISARWGIQSASTLYLVARGDSGSINRLNKLSHQLIRYSQVPQPTILLLPHATLSARERRTLIDSAKKICGSEVRILPRDVRGIERAASERAPLLAVLPKSLLAREFSTMISASSKKASSHK